MRDNVIDENKIKDKIASTEQSKNSSANPLVFAPIIQPHELEAHSMKLFTFMNASEDNPLKPVKKQHQEKTRNKNSMPKPNRMKRNSSCLKKMIDDSRKKRQSFLKNIIEDEGVSKCSLTNLNRKCKTPIGNIEMDSFFKKVESKSKTPRLSVCRQDTSINQISKKRLSRAKNSLREMSLWEGKNVNNSDKKKMEDMSKIQLLKKKQLLEKQLMEVNESLFLKKKQTKRIKQHNPKGKKKK